MESKKINRLFDRLRMASERIELLELTLKTELEYRDTLVKQIALEETKDA